MKLKQLRKKAEAKAEAAGPEAVQELAELRTEFAQSAKKKTRVAQVTSIKRNDPPMSMELAQKQLTGIAQYISSLLSPDAQDMHVAMAFSTCKALESNIETMTKLAREEVLRRLKAGGQLEGGTLRLEHNGWALKATRTHMGLDPKKVEARLRERKIDPAVLMAPDIIYKLNPDTEAKLLETLGDAAEECHYTERWQVATPERVNEMEYLP
jgi:hypothetical protein